MASNTFYITGRVINQSGQGVENLRVEAWDNDLLFDDLVGSATTDSDGRFQMSFDDSYFKELFLDRHPDLFFKVFSGGTLITDTRDNVIWNLGIGTDPNAHIVIEVDIDPGAVDKPFVVEGTVRDISGDERSGYIVRAYDKDMRHEQFLKEATCDGKGRYRINYTRGQFKRSEKRSADLVIRAFGPDAPELVVGESEVLFNAAPSETIDITIGQHLSEYEQYIQFIDQVREGVPVGDLTEADIIFLHGETDISTQRLRYMIAADHLGQETQINPAVFYGLARQDFPTVLIDLVTRNFWEIRQALERSLDADIIPEHLRPELDAIINQLKTFATDPVDVSPFQPIEVQATNLGLVTNIALLDASKVTLLQAKFSSLVSLNDGALNALVASQDLTEDDAKEVGLCASLYHLVDENVPLVQTLRNWDFPMVAGGKIQTIKDLIFVTRGDWEALLTAADVTPPDGKTLAQYAVHLSRKIENLYPTDVLLQRLTSQEPQKLAADLNALQPLIKKNQGAFSRGNFRRLDVVGISDQDALRKKYDALRRLANAYPGLNLAEVLDDHERTAQTRGMQIVNRIELLMLFQANNPEVELLHLDYAGGSAAVEDLNFNGLSDEDQVMVLANMKACQRIYTLAKDIEHTRIILEAGYQASSDIVQDGQTAFQSNTGLDENTAASCYNEALEAVGKTTATVATIFDGLWGGLDWTDVGNIGPFIEDYFKSIDGYDELFGNQDFCRCEHCQSILSPAAYFVDLMHFINTKVLDEDFHEAHREHVLYLKSRRPDLWELPLTCQNTHTLISQLVIVTEIFENYIARKEGYAGSLEDREAVNDAVYHQCLWHSQDSFDQPFTLPLETLQIYLEHFDVTREQIARLLEEEPAVVAAACFGLSQLACTLITQPNEGQTFLRKLYDIHFEINDNTGGIEAIDAQRLLPPMHLTREELGQLISTSFVTAGGFAPITIVGEKTDEDSVQNDIERIYGLTLGALDRMHRFTRLWKRLAWSIRELDLVLTHLDARDLSSGIEADTLDRLVDILPIQKRFETTVESLCPLWSDLPTTAVTDNKTSYFDRLFNQAGYAEIYPDNPPRFVHPAFGNTGDENLNRLLGGLRVNDEDLCRLILYLAIPLAADEGDKGFNLSLSNLTLLYRHARLAEWLKLPIDDLFQLIGYVPEIEGDYIATLDDLMALLAFWDWWQSSAYTLDELTFITSPDEFTIDEEIVPSMLERIESERALIFADTVFSHLEDVTETQSRDIIKANPQSIEIAVESENLYWLSKAFDPQAALIIPDDIVADGNDLKSVLMAYHASEVIPVYLAGIAGTSLDQAHELIPMTDFDLNDDYFTNILHGNLGLQDEPDPQPEPNFEMLIALVTRFIRLSLLFIPARYGADMLEFVYTHGDIFGITDFNALAMASVHKISLYGHFDENRPDDFDINDLHVILASFDPHARQFPHEDNVQEALAWFLNMELNASRVLQESISLSENPLEALSKLYRCGEQVQYLGVGGEALGQIVSMDYNDLVQASRAIYGAFRAKYQDEAEWQAKIAPFEEIIIGRRRDGLSDYLIHCIHPEFNSLSDLYYYFLIDAQVDSCFKTSKIVAANSSLQLYVHRILMNMEQDAAGNFHVKPKWVPRLEWEWRKHYRVWEANRKVFLWPENYILPDLRDNKTPLFETLESDLLQQKIDNQTVLDAYGAYIQSFEEIANLKIAGTYHDIGVETDVLHLFGVTASDPPNYYYRPVENAHHGAKSDSRGTVWHPWQEMDVKIPVRKVAPILYNGRLYVFWVEIVTSPQNTVTGGSSRFVGYKHKLSLKYTSLRLDGRWTVPQRVSLYGPYPFGESDGVVDDPLADPKELLQFSEDLEKLIYYGIFSVDLAEDLKDLTTPRYDDRPHGKAIEGYTLEGFAWEQVYIDNCSGNSLVMSGSGYQMRAEVDLFNKVIRKDSESFKLKDIQFKHNNNPPGKVLCGKNDAIYYAEPSCAFFDDYAFTSLVLEREKIDSLLYDWEDDNIQTIVGGLSYDASQKIAEISGNNLSIINGVFIDAVVDLEGDLLLLQGSVREGSGYLLRRLGTTLSHDVALALFTKGVEGLLDVDTQKSLNEADNPIEPADPVNPLIEDAVNAGKLDFEGPYGVYYREIFFHIPFLIAHHLNSQGKYADAQRWYHYIFDPTSSELIDDDPDLSDAENAARKKDRNWRYLEFRGRDMAALRAMLNDPATTETYKRNPFNPHAIARLRLGAYQKCIVMKYIDNLLDWGDDLFAQFQMETVNEATMLYITAADILGPRPAELGACSEDEDAQNTYDDIRPDIEEGSEFLIEMEHWSRIRGSIQFKDSQKFTYDYSVDRLHLGSSGGWQYAVMSSDAAMMVEKTKPPLDDAEPMTAMAKASGARTRTAMTMWPLGEDQFSGSQWQMATEIENNRKVQPEFGWAMVRQLKTVFCVPHNKTMLQYWDRVEDRLYKIRNCMDITGARRQLSLFAPEIDPGLLVRAKAAGLSLDDVLDSVSGHLPPYRFSYLIGKAMNYATTVQSFGNALLGALEKKDAEELTLLRATHEQNILKLTTKVRGWEIDAARETLDSLEAQIVTVENRRDHFQGLIETGLTDWEQTQQVTRHLASTSRGTEAAVLFLAGITHLIPQVGSPFAMKYGGKNIGDSLGTLAFANRALADLADQISASAGLEAGFQRRSQDWRRQVDQANDEMVQVEKQVEAANIRLAIAERSLEIHEKSKEQLEEIDAFYRDKFTALGLYTWLSTELQRLYRQAYSSAYSMARLAEQAYRFERDDQDEALLSHDYWDASWAGLLAGGRLLMDLQNMERQYIETNYRELEINQSFSLAQIDPTALIRLKEDGSCAFSIPELFFNLYYPGHYRRRIKAVRLTIPCVTGPYTNVSATLTLTGSSIRKDPDLNSSPVEVPVSRTTHIATSSGQNDAGVFELNFRDERYMPFEGAGAADSRWELTLPKTFRPFDYQTISDVILHISYTAKVDGALREDVESLNQNLEDTLADYLRKKSVFRIFSLHHDFSNEFHRLLTSPPVEPVQIQIMDKHFPIFLKGHNIQIRKADLILGTAKDQSIEGFKIQVDDSLYGAAAGDHVFDDSNEAYGNLWSVTLDSTFTDNLFNPHAFSIEDTGALTAESSRIDPKKLTDIYLYLEYGIDG